MTRISFLGMGVMGRGMAANILAKNGFVTVWNRTAERCAELETAGATVAASARDAIEGAEIISLCLSNTDSVEEVIFGSNGIFPHLKEGQVIIDFSTIAPDATVKFAEMTATKNVPWIDAPVSGGDVGAKNGTLSIMYGGTQDAVKRAEPLFQMVGKAWKYMGPVGNGQKTKLANQVAVAGSLAAMGEALVFAQKSGLDPEAVLEAISGGAAGSWSLSNYGPRILKGDFKPGFSASLQAKDLRLVKEAFDGLSQEFPVTELMNELFARMEAEGLGNEGNHAVVKLMGWKKV